MGTVETYFEAGGFVMYVILAVSVVGWVIFFERAWALYVVQRLAAEPFIRRVVALVQGRRFREALDATNLDSKHPVVGVMRAGVLRADRRVKEIERGMEKVALDALPSLQKRISFLSLLANASTLLGLLGTIFGLIGAFDSVGAATATERQSELSNGISQAMYTTAFGIAVAIPLLFFHHFLQRRSDVIISEVEQGATSLIVALTGDAVEPPSSTEPADNPAPSAPPLPA